MRSRAAAFLRFSRTNGLVMEPEAARAEARRFARFLVVGAAAFVVETGALTVFALGLSLHRVLAKGLAFVLAVITSFVANYFWAYRDSRTKPLAKQVTEFSMISLVGLGVNLATFSFVDWACAPFLSPALALYVAHAAAVGAAMIWNFLANRLITYNDVHIGS